ncbi:MAG TPA: ATP-grasp domain-containing protein [Firmicutes bacterium]|nr:ATP-grasp domain-containing protein [Bacillota bacterium]
MGLRVAIVFNRRMTEAAETKIYKDRPQYKGQTIARVQGALNGAGHQTALYDATRHLMGALEDLRPDIVFNLATGIEGKTSQSYVPALLEVMNIPYTGSGPLAHGIALDKGITKKILAHDGVNTPEFRVVKKDPAEAVEPPPFQFPVIVKPAREGSSRGITRDSVANTKDELVSRVRRIIDDLKQPAIVEQFIAGREFTVGVMGNEDPYTLPILEIGLELPHAGRGSVYTYDVKARFGYTRGCKCPADLSEAEASAIRDAALKTYRVLGCRDYARVDIILGTDGVPYVLELNSLPGLFVEYSAFPVMAKAAGMEFEQLVTKILDYAAERYRLYT